MTGLNPFWEGTFAVGAFLMPGLVVALGLFFLQRLLSKQIRPGVWKALWILLAVKLVVPAGLWEPFENLVQGTSRSLWEQFTTQPLPEGQLSPKASGPSAPEQGTAAGWLRNFPKTTAVPNLGNMQFDSLPLFYLLGLTLSLSFFGARILSARFLVGRSQEAEDPRLFELLLEASESLKIKKTVRLLVSDLCPGPASWGYARPAVLLPRDFASQLSDEQLKIIFLHELAHIKSRDSWTLILMDLFCTLFWFHPAVWIIRRNLKLTLELKADQKSLEVPSAPTPQDYGHTLLSVLTLQVPGPLLPGAKAMAGTAGELKVRIKKIRDYSPLRARSLQIGGFVVLVLLILGTTMESDVPRLPPGTYNRDQFFRYADVLMEEMEWDKAAQIYRYLLDQEPRQEGAANTLSRILMSQEKYHEALKTLEEVELRDPWSWITSARLKDALGRRDEAIQEYSYILSDLSPQDSIRRLARAGVNRPLSPRKALPFMAPDQGEISSLEKGIMAGIGRWTAIASQTHSLHPTAAAFDGDPNTRWSTPGNMAPGDSFILDLGSARNLKAIALIDDAEGRTIYTNDYPRRWILEFSPDGTRWYTAAQGAGKPDIYVGAAFPSQPVKAIRITQMGQSDAELWSIYEIRLWEEP